MSDDLKLKYEKLSNAFDAFGAFRCSQYYEYEYYVCHGYVNLVTVLL